MLQTALSSGFRFLRERIRISMTTGEKLALLRKKKGITQEALSEILQVSRQSVSRWEMDAAFPETDKLIKLSKLYECSIDFLLNDDIQESGTVQDRTDISECYQFIRDCGYFFLATSVEDKPRLRPFGMVYSDGKNLFIVTDKRKKVYAELMRNPQIEIASYNPGTRRWIRISGRAEAETSSVVWEEIMMIYPVLRQKYLDETGIYIAVYKLLIEDVSIM